MDTVDFPRFLLAFLFVLGLIGVMAAAMRRYGNKAFLGQDTGGRLRVVETRYLDPKRRLVIVRRDHTEHLLLLAGDRETVIETFGAPDAK